MSNTITNGNYYYSQSAFVQSAHYYSNQTFGNNDFQSAVIKKDEDSSEVVDALAKEEPAKKEYTRVITANVWNSGMTSTQLADGKTAYSYQGVMQKFEIRIDVMGDSRKYTATGIDENGNEFSKEIDPYKVNPTDSDFTEFAALCSYIRDTEGIADEAMQAVDGVAPYDIFEKKNYLSELSGSINNFQMMGVSTLGAEQLLSHINRLMEVIMTSGVGNGISPEPVENATTFAGAKFWGDTGSFGTFSGIRFQAISYYGTREIGGADSATAERPVEISDKEDDQKEIVSPIIGMSSIPVGNMSYVMTASEVFKPGSDEAIVRVHVGGKDIDVNINEVDPKNASAVEMFAYCQYADAHDTGTGYTFGSYNVLKGVTDPLGKSEYTSLDEAISKKSNWNDAISGSKASFTKEQTGEKYDASILLKMLEETAGLFASQSGDKDLGELTDEEWEKLLGNTDKAIDEAKETAQTDDTYAKARLRYEVSVYASSVSSAADTFNQGKAELGLISMDANGIRYSNSETNGIEWEIEFQNEEDYERAQLIMEWVAQNNISSEFIADKDKWSDFMAGKISEASFKNWIQNGSAEESEELKDENEAERTKRLIQEYWENGKIKKAMDGYEFIKMQGELIERNVEMLRQTQKTTRERLLEQDPNAASKWYMYDGSSKRYSFDEFCKFMDAKDAEMRANAPEWRNPYLEMANYYLNKRKV